jgi:hypothetical protein
MSRNVKTLFLTVFEVLTEGNEGLVFEAQIKPLFSLLPSVKVFLCIQHMRKRTRRLFAWVCTRNSASARASETFRVDSP